MIKGNLEKDTVNMEQISVLRYRNSEVASTWSVLHI